MARPIAADYAEKRAAIRKAAARLFAEQGYDRTAMADIGASLGVSKARFYHYYKAKDDLLFDIIASHLNDLVRAAEAAASTAGPPRRRLAAFIDAILDCYRDADHEHKIQINHLSQLDAARQAELKNLERRLVDLAAQIIAALNPAIEKRLVKPLTMSLFGTLNWKYMWFREGGAVSRADFAALITGLYADGIAAAATDRKSLDAAE
jgi:TetR/AcrR family transcriptional regulator